MNKYFGISLIVLGIALAALPQFTDCAAHGKFMTTAMGMQMPMHCYGNRTPVLAIGIGMLAVGAVMTFARFKSKGAFFSLAGIALVLGAGAILMPTQFVGTCGKPTMFCNTMMKPSVIGVSSLAMLSSAIGMVAVGMRRSADKILAKQPTI